MRELYQSDYINRYLKLKKRMLVTYFVIMALSIGALAFILIYYATEPYQTSSRVPLMIAMFAVIVFFIVYSFIFFTITYGKVRSYCNFLLFSVCATRSTDKVTVLNVFNDIVDKNGGDCTRIEVLEWSDAENDFVERMIYVDNEVVVDDVFEGDILTIVTNSKYLLAYNKETA